MGETEGMIIESQLKLEKDNSGKVSLIRISRQKINSR